MEKIKAIFQRLFLHDKWAIGISEMDYAQLIEQAKITPPTSWLEGKFGQYIADPFIFKYNNDYYLFYELFRYITGDAKIAVSRLTKENNQWVMADNQLILDKPFHQSYPYIFTENDKIYCLPEQSEAGCVKLYQAIDFPLKWKLIATLIENFPVVDPTLFLHQGQWWLLATKGGGQQDSHLYAWYADSLEGPWTPHQHNPVKTGFGQTRPAGTAFKLKSGLYRPVQGFKKRYGDGLLIYKIDELSPTLFKESLILDLQPFEKYPFGLHHLSISSGIAVFDGKRYASLVEVVIKFSGIILRKLKNNKTG